MIMSNFIDEAERRAELYNAFTPRQRSILNIIERSHRVGDDDNSGRLTLLANDVSEAEIHWLQRTGRFLPGYSWGDQAIDEVATAMPRY